MEMTEEAKKLRNAYRRELYKRNAERERERQVRYWNRKAARAAEEKKDAEGQS